MLDERTLFAFQQDARFETLHPVPGVLGDVDPIVALFLTDYTGLYHLTLIGVDKCDLLASVNIDASRLALVLAKVAAFALGSIDDRAEHRKA